MSKKRKRNKRNNEKVIIPDTRAKKKYSVDGFANALTGVGTFRDPGQHNQWRSRGAIQRQVIDDMYAENKLFSKCIDLYPDDGLRKWVTYNHDKKTEIDQVIKALKAKKHLKRAAKREALHGGCAIFIDLDDGQGPDMPVNRKNIKSIKELILVEAHYIYPEDAARGCDSEYFRINTNRLNMLIHKSRLMIFPGIEVSDDYNYTTHGWGESKARRLLEPIERREMILNNIKSLSGRMVVPHWGIEGLSQMVEDDDTEKIKQMFEARLLGESVVNSVVTDSMDKYAMVSPNLSGINQLSTPADKDILQASDIPHTKLFLESPGASLGATGGSQERNWFELVASYQEDKLREHIEMLFDYIVDMLKLSEPVVFTFTPLGEPSLLDLAKIHTEQAKSDQIYEAIDVLSVEEIRESRFGGGEYSVETRLDDRAYKGALEASIEQAVKDLESNVEQDNAEG